MLDSAGEVSLFASCDCLLNFTNIYTDFQIEFYFYSRKIYASKRKFFYMFESHPVILCTIDFIDQFSFPLRNWEEIRRKNYREKLRRAIVGIQFFCYSQNPELVILVCRFHLVLKSKKIRLHSRKFNEQLHLRTVANHLKCFKSSSLVGQSLPEVLAVVGKIHK